MRTILFNEIRMFLRDRRAVMLTFFMPMALISLFAVIFGGAGKKSDMGEIELGICDLDKTSSSAKLVTRLDTSSAFIIQACRDSLELKERVFKGKLSSGLVILPRYEQNLQAGKTAFVLYADKTRRIELSIVQPLLLSVLMETAGEKMMKPAILKRIKDKWPGMDSTRLAEIDNNMNEFMTGNFMSNQEPAGEMYTLRAFVPPAETNPGLIQAFAGTAVMTLLFAVAGMGTAIIEEKERGTLKKILTSPVTPLQFLMGKTFSAVMVSTLQLSVLAVFTWLAFGLPVFQYPLQILVLILVTALACSSFGIFLATITTSRKQIESLSTLIVLLMSMLGGSMVPTFFMPALMQKFSAITINYWSTQGFFDIFLRQTGMPGVLYRSAVLLLFFAVLTLVSLYFARKKLFRV